MKQRFRTTALKNGEKNRNVQIVKEMYQNDLPIELIVKISKLSKEEVLKILNA